MTPAVCEGCSFGCNTKIGRICALWAAAVPEGQSAQEGFPGFTEHPYLSPKL